MASQDNGLGLLLPARRELQVFCLAKQLSEEEEGAAAALLDAEYFDRGAPALLV